MLIGVGVGVRVRRFKRVRMLFITLFPAFAVVAVDVAVLAHSVGVQLIVRAVPRLFVAAKSVIAIAAHAFGIMFSVRVTAVCWFFTEFRL